MCEPDTWATKKAIKTDRIQGRSRVSCHDTGVEYYSLLSVTVVTIKQC